MNVISNAVDYSPNNGKIYFEIKSMDNKISFIITDCGKGFSRENIKSATKQFYMGDCSRASKSHYGIGLYITQSFVKLHGGTLQVANSTVTGGAEVTIQIPICQWIVCDGVWTESLKKQLIIVLKLVNVIKLDICKFFLFMLLDHNS